MIRISCYQTSNEKLPKTFTLLAEKCYYNKLKTLVVTKDMDLTNILDKALWTYSKKHFIPHGTSSDPMPYAQPIYITDSLTNPNNSEIVIFVNISESTILNFLSQESNPDVKATNFSRIMFLFDEFNKLENLYLKNILEKSSLTDYTQEYFLQGLGNDWQKMTA